MVESPLPKKLTKNFIHRFRSRLLQWYAQNGRDLPWRRTRDPYKIWISEIMLQQTQVPRVITYYSHFLSAFPTLETLAQSSLSKVLKKWEGLGYYSRARNLHRAAKMVTEDDHGHFPKNLETFQKLPGVGPYTAGAVMSIAFNQPYPVVDGNAGRVLCRVFGEKQNPREQRIQQQLTRIAARLLPRRRAGDFNQAIMDLGALVCRPKGPNCTDCCLKPLCFAQTLPDPSALPVKEVKLPTPHYDVTAGVIWKGRKILLAQRYPKGLLGGMWEFPGGKREQNESLEACLRREIQEELGIETKIIEPIASVKHAYTHFRITLHGFHCQYISGRTSALGCADWKWVFPEEITSYALPRADVKLLEVWEGKRGLKQ